MRQLFILYSIAGILVIALLSSFRPVFLWAFILLLPLIFIGTYDLIQTRHTLWRNFPLISHWRWIMEALRVPMQQYFIESDNSGAPTNRMFRSVVYQRSKKQLDTISLGTKVDVYRIGYEWMDHSLSALEESDINKDLRIVIGGSECRQPYDASLFNISAMSFGALSQNAILALNSGAKIDHFAHNTGEGSISPYHLKPGGDLIWQIGTAYFGCRTPDGQFSADLFKKKACLNNVKMIEIKLSQGAKPGHGGILPASKNTPEIAKIRHTEAFIQIDSPATHSAFSNPIEMMYFIKQLRELSAGKPIGFKLCVGRRSEFVAICKAMVETGIKPDFITVDGGEGGTGAAPLEYSNSVGVPLRDALAFVIDCLMGFDLKKEIKVIVSGKILTGFHLVKNLALGADLCNSARGMMLALGCIQSLECNKNKCPTGIATQNPKFTAGLVVTDKKQRVANFHHETIKSVRELLAASGLEQTKLLNRSHIHRRVSATQTLRYDQIFPYVATGSLLTEPYPKQFEQEMKEATANSFRAKKCFANVDGEMVCIVP
ncbi:MAG: FMN-binding glutamate synthase family protein [Gammaproteobacteria bacterium]|nr:MAG: FMN-binding glutamate synthase family protein [Gammaproteobacteria bacterium]